MGYFEEKKSELEGLIATINKEKETFERVLKSEVLSYEDKIAWFEKLKEGVQQMAKERQIGFPWLAEAYSELFKMRDEAVAKYLRTKKRPAVQASEIVREHSRLRREALKEAKVANYLVKYYESIAPFLVDFKEEVDVPTEEDRQMLQDYSEEEKQDEVINFLSKEDYRKLPSIERNQLALDRFWGRHHSKWLIGRLYERYVGFLYEQQGYDVDYVGIFKGFEDLGRDLICKKGKALIVIQCKNWSQFRTIYEKHIFQFFGTVFQYKDENPGKSVTPIFYTSTSLSDLARRFAKELNIELKENFKFDNKYPSIKCNISKVDGTKIYHLPFDQQYDNTKIEVKRGEFYCATVKEAEDKGFRRAFRYKGISGKKA